MLQQGVSNLQKPHLTTQRTLVKGFKFWLNTWQNVYLYLVSFIFPFPQICTDKIAFSLGTFFNRE